MLAERLMVGSEVDRFVNRLGGLRLVEGGKAFADLADVSRNGSSFSINDKRSYDAWGNLRSGATSGDPKGRYCANLGHVEDDESNLIYMRARYYAPTSGRFLSEDAQLQKTNWYVYSSDDPVNRSDLTGADDNPVSQLYDYINSIARALGIQLPPWFKATSELAADIYLAISSYEKAVGCFQGAQVAFSVGELFGASGMTSLSIETMGAGIGLSVMGAAFSAVAACALEDASIDLCLALLDEDPDGLD